MSDNNESVDKPQWVGVIGLCKHLQLSKETVYRMTKDNRIPHTKIGKSIRYNLEQVDRFLIKKTILRKSVK